MRPTFGNSSGAATVAMSAAPKAQNDIEVLQNKIVNVNSLPMLPEVATRAMAIIRDVNAPIRALTSLIERDPALATGVLRLVNSPFFRTGRAIESLEQAVARLGMRECQNLIITVSIRTLYRSVPASKRQRCESLWQHSFITGSLCRALNQRLKLGFQGQEFSCGICHDIGRLLVAVGAPGYFDLVDPMDFREGPNTLAKEKAILGLDHAQLGGWFTRLNEMPDALATTIEFHHNPLAAPENQGLATLIAMGDDMANHLQRGEPIEEYEPASSASFGWAGEVWGEESCQRFEEEARQIMTEVAQAADGVAGFH